MQFLRFPGIGWNYTNKCVVQVFMIICSEKKKTATLICIEFVDSLIVDLF
jgi:hypothetical protein